MTYKEILKRWRYLFVYFLFVLTNLYLNKLYSHPQSHVLRP